VISANARAAERCRSTLSENERVVSAARGEPVKKFVVVRSTGSLLSDGKMGSGRALTFKVLKKISYCLSLVLEK
jgi:hypothetical protein